jgi:glycerol-3-phosphate cytidylyltransferase
MIFNKIRELKDKGLKIGITFSTFDMLTIDRPDTKNKPVQSIVERQIQLAACRYVDEVVVYQTEQDLIDLLLILPLDVRILGVEYENKDFTGKKECWDREIELVFNGRDHSFSSSSLRKRVAAAEAEKALRS